MIDALINTLAVTGAALGLGLLGGILTSFLYWSPLQSVGYRLAAGASAIPVTALLPLFINVFGVTDFVVPAVAYPTWLMSGVALLSALRQLNEDRKQAVRLGRLSLSQYVVHIAAWEVILPFIAVVRICLPLTIALVIALDYFLHVVEGLGLLIYQRSSNYDMLGMWLAIGVVWALSLSTMEAVNVVHRMAEKWSSSQ